MVDIFIPLYNGEKYIIEAIESIRKQTYQEFKLYIVYNGGLDNSYQIVKQYLKQINDNRIELIDNSHNPGIANNWNYCILNSTAKYFTITHQDDKLHKECIQEMIKFMEENPEYALAYCDIYTIDSNGSILFSLKNLFKRLLRKPYISLDSNFKTLLLFPIIPCPTLFYRKEIVDKIGLFNTKYRNELDWEYQIRVILEGYKIGYLPKKLYFYRKHEENESKKNTNNFIKYIEIEDMLRNIKLTYTKIFDSKKINTKLIFLGLFLIIVQDIFMDLISFRRSFVNKFFYLIKFLTLNIWK